MSKQFPAPHQWENTIVGLPFESPYELQTQNTDNSEARVVEELAVEQQKFKIRLATVESRRDATSVLIKKMYSWRGYLGNGPASSDQPADRLTLMAVLNERTIGTITLGLDSPGGGLFVDDMYQEEIEPLRRAGKRLCEFTKLAVDQNIRSKKVLAAIFHIACIYAMHIYKCTDLMIEVNPRHVKFYEKMLGFRVFGREKICERVNAPAVLLWLDFNYLDSQIVKYGGGRRKQLGGDRSLYPFFFSKEEEQGITNRLLSRG